MFANQRQSHQLNGAVYGAFVEGDAARRGERSIPGGIVTFLFTDVEGSTQLWAQDRSAMSASLEQHDSILRAAFESRGGYVFTTAGDSFAVAFSRASDAVEAASAAQTELGEAGWPGPALRVRMGLHLGETEERGGDYFGPVVNLTARLESAGHGGQVLLTDQVRLAAMAEVVDLGIHQLRDVPDPLQIFQFGDHEFPALRIVAPGRTNLPAAASRLIGRDEALAEVREALTEHRLVSLTATGGTGKTRLALAVGEAELTNRRGGVWFVDLTPVTDGGLVAATIAAAVGLVITSGDPTTAVVDYLSDLDALVVLDNCEHLVDDCAEFLEIFVSRSGSSRVLATTREFFDVDGERPIRLSPLAVEGESSAAVRLFVERALAVDPAFRLEADDRSAVADLCRHLDGSPLAIELAAARANVMSPTELLAGIGQRFELLRGGRRRRSRRTLEDTLDWSYDLLDNDEKTLFRTLGAFSGSFDLDAVEAVAVLARGVALDLMDSLIAKSLVVSERVSGSVRFRLLETTAAYAEQALEQAEEAEQVRDRHLAHYLERCAPFEIGIWPTMLAISLAADRDNIRAAIEWAGITSRWQDAGRLVYGASTVLQTQPEELLSLASGCLAHLRDTDPARTIALHSIGILMDVQLDDFVGASATADALRRSPHPLVQSVGILWTCFFEFNSNRPERSLAAFAEGTDLISGLPDSVIRSQQLFVFELCAGWANAYMGHNEEALRNHSAAQAYVAESAPGTAVLAESWASEGVAHITLGNPTAALDCADVLDTRHYIYFNGDELRAAAHLALGDLDAARPIIRAHARDAVTGRLSRKANNALLLLALLAEAEHDEAHAAQLLMNVENARSPNLPLSLELANRLDVREAFDTKRTAATGDQYASGRRAIIVLREEMIRLGWHQPPNS